MFRAATDILGARPSPPRHTELVRAGGSGTSQAIYDDMQARFPGKLGTAVTPGRRTVTVSKNAITTYLSKHNAKIFVNDEGRKPRRYSLIQPLAAVQGERNIR